MSYRPKLLVFRTAQRSEPEEQAIHGRRDHSEHGSLAIQHRRGFRGSNHFHRIEVFSERQLLLHERGDVPEHGGADSNEDTANHQGRFDHRENRRVVNAVGASSVENTRDDGAQGAESAVQLFHVFAFQ